MYFFVGAGAFGERFDINLVQKSILAGAVGLEPTSKPRLLRESKSRALPLGDAPIYKTEPKDFHLWEQRLGLCLQPLPAVFPLYATNISNRFTLLLHTSVLLRDFLFDRDLPDLNREPTQHLWVMLPLTPDF